MNRYATLFLASASLGACAPLSQAGLVYASHGRAGISLATGTAQTPGFDLNIGMSISDFAYIPVAVGRPCASGDTTCRQDLIPIIGTSNAASQNSDNGNSTPAPDPAPAPAGSKASRGGGGQDAPPAPAQEPAPTVEQVTAIATQTAADVARKESQSQTAQYDSFSVYGTFNSDAHAPGSSSATTSNTGASLGRTFSTGVASQNLTQGQRDALRAQAYAQCLVAANNAVKDVTPAEAQNTLRQDLLRGCAATQRP